MKKLIAISNIFFLFLVFGIAFAIHEITPLEKIAPLPGLEAQAIYKYITKEDHYKNWSLWPGKGELYKGRHPHGAYLTTYINDVADLSIKAGKPMVNGAIIVKENYSPKKKLAAVTVMYKIKGYNPSAGDWFWIKYGADGKVLKSGKVKGCINCHLSQKANDFVFTGRFVK
jgi:hypothetical protein